MKFVSFATAGHVDHGKTALIKSLTGIDTDRLPEEKERGMSIDVGFAFLDFPEDNLRVELLDVPGHERFIKNAIVGIAPAQALLLVVDPSEGIMPQTTDHVRVAKALGIKRGVVAVTKIDAVEKELIEVARQEIEDFLEEEGLNFPIVEVSAKEGWGLGDLKNAIRNTALEVYENRTQRPLRIFLDSAFVVKGYGTVLRGSCVEGKVREGQNVAVEPIGKLVKVRKIQNHGRFVEEVRAVGRVALNVPQLEAKEVKRGFWVLEENTYIKSKVLILEADREIPVGKPAFFFFGMREVEGKAKKVEGRVYLIYLEEDVVSRRGDRVVALNSQGRFLSGGTVLHPAPKVKKKAFIRSNLSYLKESFLDYLLKEHFKKPLSKTLYLKLTGNKLEEAKGNVIMLGERLISEEVIDSLQKEMEGILKEVGILEAETLRSLVNVDEDLFSFVVESMHNLVRREGPFLILKTQEKRINARVRDLVERLRRGPIKEEDLLEDKKDKIFIDLALQRGEIYRTLGGFLLSRAWFEGALKKLRSLGETFETSKAKEVLGLSRKVTVEVLELADRMGITVREGGVRRWRA